MLSSQEVHFALAYDGTVRQAGGKDKVAVGGIPPFPDERYYGAVQLQDGVRNPAVLAADFKQTELADLVIAHFILSNIFQR